MIKIAHTQQQIEDCKEWLKSRGYNTTAKIYIYTEKENVITACCGIVYVGMIEPFESDNKADALQLFNFAQGLISSKVEFIGAMTHKENVKDLLNNKLDFTKWSFNNSEIYIKEI